MLLVKLIVNTINHNCLKNCFKYSCIFKLKQTNAEFAKKKKKKLTTNHFTTNNKKNIKNTLD